jgi:DNA-binding transcriptional regulator YiaG
VFDGPTTTEPGPTGESAIMVWHGNVVDEPLAAFLVDRGYGGRLRPLSDEEVASPGTEFSRVATPKHVRDWYAAEVAAGRIIPPEQLPPPAVRRQLRESAGLSRRAVGELVGVSGEAVRLWETGGREPQGDNRGAYLSLLTSWQSGPQESAEEPAEPEPEPILERQPGVQPRRGPLTNLSHREALTAAVQAHQARMERVYGRPG